MSGAYPESSRASKAARKSNRCWGSMDLASRGDMEKYAGSNSNVSERKLPYGVEGFGCF